MLTTIDFHRAVARIKTLSGDGGGAPPVTVPSFRATAQTVDDHKSSTAMNMPTHATDDILLLVSIADENA